MSNIYLIKTRTKYYMKGTYCLIINLSKDSKIRIGNVLGKIEFKKGSYVYIGSAMNSLESRVKRHLSDDKKKHWHVDYLLLNKNSKIDEILLNISDKKIECDLAKAIQKNEKIIPKFGCSDCYCDSHLVYFENSKLAIEKVKESYDSIEMPYTTLEEFNRFL